MPQLFLLDNLAISSHVYHSRSKLGRGMGLFVCTVLDVSTMLSHSLFHKTGTAVQASRLGGHVKRNANIVKCHGLVICQPPPNFIFRTHNTTNHTNPSGYPKKISRIQSSYRNHVPNLR